MDFDAFFRSIVRQESAGDPNAVSPKGALGLMQIMPDTAMDPGYGVSNIFDTARSLGFDVQEETPEVARMLLRQPEINETFGRAYMGAMIRTFNSPDKALAAYNAGPGFVADEWSGRFEDLPKETRGYITNIRNFYEQETGEAFPSVLAPPPRGGERADALQLRQAPGGDRNLLQGIGDLARGLVDPEYRAEQDALRMQAYATKRGQVLDAIASGQITEGEGERLLLGLEEQSEGPSPMGLVGLAKGIAAPPDLPQRLPTTVLRGRSGSGTSAIQCLGVNPLV